MGPIVYAFFPETNQLELEDIDHLFDKGGLTGGVWQSKGGGIVEHGGHVRDVSLSDGMPARNGVCDEKDGTIHIA